MLEDAGLIIVILLAARGYFACASDLGRMLKVHFCEKARDEEEAFWRGEQWDHEEIARVRRTK